MDQSRYDMAVHLEAALAEWTAQVMQAHLNLAEQISHGQDRFAAELEGQPAGKTGSDVLAEVRAEIDVLGQMLADPDGQPGAASSCVARLKEAISNLYAELRTLRSQTAVSEMGLRNREDLAQELTKAVHERDAAAEEAAALRKANEELTRAAQEAEEQGKEAIAAQAFDATGHKRLTGEILVGSGVITQEQLEYALDEQKKNPQRPLGAIFVEMGFTGEDVVAQVLASQLQVPFVRLKKEPIDINAIRLISGPMATRHTLIPIRATSDCVVVAMTNPLDLIALDDVERATNRRVEPVVATLSDISEAIARYYSVT